MNNSFQTVKRENSVEKYLLFDLFYKEKDLIYLNRTTYNRYYFTREFVYTHYK